MASGVVCCGGAFFKTRHALTVGQMSDESLLNQFQDGDPHAFREIVVRHRDRLFRFVRRHVRSATAAEDIVQETFVRVVQNAAEFKKESRFSTWLFAIARNLCIDQLRKNALRRHDSLDQNASADAPQGSTFGEKIADPQQDVERTATSHELRTRMSAAIDSLPEEQREVFLLRELSAMPFKEIAVITRSPENTVKSRMRYALEHLQEVLSEYEDFAKTRN
jgi:RNA polymerase sigma-70 factor, ECF subfamily